MSYILVSMSGKHEQLVSALDGQQSELARNHSLIGGWESDLACRQLHWSDDHYVLLGLQPGAVPASLEAWKQCIHADDRERFASAVICGPGAEAVCIEYRVVMPDRQVHWLASRGKVVQDQTGQPASVIGVTVDITEARETQQRLDEFNRSLARYSVDAQQHAAQLRELTAQLTQVENRERRKLALLLHDHLQQLLIASRMKVGAMEKRIKKGPLIPLLTRTAEMLQEAIVACRSLSVELSPPMLYESGLGAAFNWLAEQMQDKHGLEVELSISDEPQDEDIRAFLFQCVRELLFNVVKHAGVAKVMLCMQRMGSDRIAVTIRDDGKGFDPPNLHTKCRHCESFGLRSIHQRLHLLGGSFEIKSALGQGTQATLIVPLHKPAVEQANPVLPTESRDTAAGLPLVSCVRR